MARVPPTLAAAPLYLLDIARLGRRRRIVNSCCERLSPVDIRIPKGGLLADIG
jgi:hypothetical protein